MKTNSTKRIRTWITSFAFWAEGGICYKKENEGKELHYTGGKFHGSGNNHLTSFFSQTG